MKTVAFCVVVVGLAIAASGQTASAPEPGGRIVAREITRSPEATLLRGGAEIRFGTTVLYADEADIRNSAPGEASEIALRGNVRARALLRAK